METVIRYKNTPCIVLEVAPGCKNLFKIFYKGKIIFLYKRSYIKIDCAEVQENYVRAFTYSLKDGFPTIFCEEQADVIVDRKAYEWFKTEIN